MLLKDTKYVKLLSVELIESLSMIENEPLLLKSILLNNRL